MIYLVIAFVISYFLGSKRVIGFGWSFFFCLFLNPVFGLLISVLSKRINGVDSKPSKTKYYWGWLLVILFTIAFIGQLMKPESIIGLVFNIGLIGIGIYLIQRSKEKMFI